MSGTSDPRWNAYNPARKQWIRLLVYEEAGAAMWAIAIVVAALGYAGANVREKVV